MSGASYGMAGEFFELCDCYTVCPCWVGQRADDNRCTGAFGWSIVEGAIDGLDVAGRQVVSVSFHSGHRETGGQEVVLYVDEDATDEQFEVLVATFTGQNGGPLGELGRLMGLLRASERVPISMANNGRYLTLTVGRTVSGDAAMLLGADGEITELSHGRLSQVLGETAEVGQSSSFQVDLSIQGFAVEVTGRAAMRGAFRYQHETETEAEAG